MKKKAKIFTVGVITLLLAITTVYAAATASGSFSLTYGKSSQSAKIKTEASYPYVKYTSNGSTASVDATVQVTLSKSSLFSLENKQRLFDIPISRNKNSVSYALFNKYSQANYIVTTVESAKDGIANATYLFSSKSSAGMP